MWQPKKYAICTHLRFTIGFCVMLYKLQFYMITQPKCWNISSSCVFLLLLACQIFLWAFVFCLQMFRRPQMVFVLCCTVTVASPVFLFLTLSDRPWSGDGWCQSLLHSSCSSAMATWALMTCESLCVCVCLIGGLPRYKYIFSLSGDVAF